MTVSGLLVDSLFSLICSLVYSLTPPVYRNTISLSEFHQNPYSFLSVSYSPGLGE